MLTLLRRTTTTAFAGVLLFAAACGSEGPALPTTLDSAETEGDVIALQAAFDAPATEAFAGLGFAMDNALLNAGGVAMRFPSAMLREGPQRPLLRERARLTALVLADDPASIPIIALGKTFVWDETTDEYVISARTGAPGNGVRFVLYAMDDVDAGLPALPLVEVGYAELTQTGTATTTSARVVVVTTGGTTIMDYNATLGGTDQVPAFAIEGFVGLGANRVEFRLNFGFNLVSQSAVTTWVTEMPARGLSSRVQLTIGESAFTIGAVMQRGLRKVELLGTLNFDTGGTLTVRVGNRLFATMVFPIDPEAEPTITNAQGLPLTVEEEESLRVLLEWFEGAFDAPSALLSPIYVLLGFDEV